MVYNGFDLLAFVKDIGGTIYKAFNKFVLILDGIRQEFESLAAVYFHLYETHLKDYYSKSTTSEEEYFYAT